MPHRPTFVLAALLTLATAAAETEPFAYTVVDAASIPVALGGLEGDAGRGAALAAEHCADCHAPGGALAAALETREPGALRLAIVNLAIALPDADADADGAEDDTLHAFYHPDAEGRTRLPAQAVEDIIAYLRRAD